MSDSEQSPVPTPDDPSQSGTMPPPGAASPAPTRADETSEAASQRSPAAITPRPPLWLRMLVDHLWVLALPLFVGLFLLVVSATNSMDLSALPAPRIWQLLGAVMLLAVLLGIPYLLFRGPIDIAREDILMRREAELAIKDAQRRLKSHKNRLKPAQLKAVEDAVTALQQVLQNDSLDVVESAHKVLDQALSDHLSFARQGTPREYGESIGTAVIIALLLRAFVVEAFKIPSGSMIPTLQIGDHIFVHKLMFGARIPGTNIKLGHHLRPPRRGEVIVFIFPEDPQKDFIKRIVGIPGDTIQVCSGQVIINNQPLRREQQPGACEYDDYDEDRPSGSWRKVSCIAYREWNGNESYITVQNTVTPPQLGVCTQSWTVPPDRVFVMGDNRDNSHDSRYWGFVPYENIKGKAWFIWWSAGERSSVRLNRMFDSIHH